MENGIIYFSLFKYFGKMAPLLFYIWSIFFSILYTVFRVVGHLARRIYDNHRSL